MRRKGRERGRGGKGTVPFLLLTSQRHSFCAASTRRGGAVTPRKPRYAPGGCHFHVTNRGNDRKRIFFESADYRAFLYRLAGAKRRYPVKLHGICLMPNHFHAIVQAEADDALSAYFQWALGRYACDLRAATRTSGYGHVFQRRFWSDCIHDGRHFLSVLRYIEANPSKAGLVPRAEDWAWSSLAIRADDRCELLDPLPLDLPTQWTDLVNETQPSEEVRQIERRPPRGRPVKRP